ncbi:MAG: hypothetical protein JST54_27910 [Deltaproteobacteria bacterium]|nr:hypothetical protein [Deltaproteobacteria bacterium]
MDMDIDLDAYRHQFADRLSDFKLLFGEYGVDFYGVPQLRGIIEALPAADRFRFVALMFLDALFESALHEKATPGVDSHKLVDRPAFIINTYNVLLMPSENISHRHPQVLLGLIGQWRPAHLDALALTTRAYVGVLIDRLPRAAGLEELFRARVAEISQDPDLLETSFDPVGLHIAETVRDTYLEALRASATAVSSR